ncbi:MAG: antibiotic biosynthesis monooxygenase [Pseudomonadota bacterium]
MGIILKGQLRCTPQEADIVRAALPEHVRLSRAEPGCEQFDIVEAASGVFEVAERFTDEAAFEAHQVRTRASDWWQKTGHIPRDIRRIEE